MHLESVAQEAADALKNYTDVSSVTTESIKRTITEDLATATATLTENCKHHLQNMRTWFDSNKEALNETQASINDPTYHKDQKVWYTKDSTSMSVPVTIKDTHHDDAGNPYYTVQFATGLEKQTISQSLSMKHNTNQATRFHAVDKNLQMKQFPTKPSTSNMNNRSSYNIYQKSDTYSPQDSRNHNYARSPNSIYVPGDDEEEDFHARRIGRHNHQTQSLADIKLHGPSADLIARFHKQFKATVENEKHLLTFYQQIHSQGKAYGILLRDIKDIRPDFDLCPSDVSHHARTVMKIALYQRLQDADCVSSDYIDAHNHLSAYSNNSDGYAALYQMLRMVHPYLMEGSKLYNAPKLSEATDLFRYAAMCRNYFLFQEIQNRIYTEKEQSEMFLQNVDDPFYLSGRAQCLTELGVATIDGSSTVRISNMKFANLPTTLQQYTNKLNMHSSSSPIVRAVKDSRSYQQIRRNNNPQHRSPSYEPFACLGCGTWGHKVTRCKIVPRIALALDYIKQKPKHVEKLVEEYKRINNKATKRSTVRVLLSNGILDSFDDPDNYLQENDIDVPMENTPTLTEE